MDNFRGDTLYVLDSKTRKYIKLEASSVLLNVQPDYTGIYHGYSSSPISSIKTGERWTLTADITIPNKITMSELIIDCPELEDVESGDYEKILFGGA